MTTVSTVLSHIFNHKICFKYAVYIVGCVWFVFNGKIELFIYCRRRPSLLKVPIDSHTVLTNDFLLFDLSEVNKKGHTQTRSHFISCFIYLC